MAQYDLGLGLAYESPFLFNKQLGGYNHYSGVPAVRLNFNYLPAQATFLPTVSFVVAPYVLPVTRLGVSDRVLLMDFTTLNLMVQGRIRKELGENYELFFGMGIGATYMTGGSSIGLSGNQAGYINVLQDSADRIKAIMPQVNLNLEYRIPISSEKPISAGLGVNVLYSYYFERSTTWRVDVVDDMNIHYKLYPKLAGHLVNPSVYVVIYYRFERNRY